MKILRFIYLLMPLITFAQVDKNISVISVEKASIIYRGIENPIKIGVPGAKSFTATSTNGNLKRIDSIGNYHWNVTSAVGTKGIIKIDAVMLDGSTRQEEKVFEVKPIALMKTVINGQNCSGCVVEMTRDALSTAIISVKVDDYYLNDSQLAIKSFELYTPKNESMLIYGDKLDSISIDSLDTFPIGSEIKIRALTDYHLDLMVVRVKIIANPLDYNRPSPMAYIKGYNTLYRGIDNNLVITVPKAKSFKVTAPGLKKTNSENGYSFNVSKIQENRVFVDYEVVTQSDSVIKYQDMYFIEDVKPNAWLINGQGCNKCIVEMNKSEFENAKISVKLGVQFSPFNLVYIRSFMITFPDNKEYNVEGDTITSKIFNKIKELPKDSTLIIKDIDFYVPGVNAIYPRSDIKIQLTD